MSVAAQELIRRYYDAFNTGDLDTFLSLMTDDIVHDINQGERQVGKMVFKNFMEEMFAYYGEKVESLEIMVNKDGTRAAAEFVIQGTYLKSASGLPVATGQKYTLPVGAFFEIKDGKVSRVTNYYNLQDWLRQVK